jgi:hypothetical protein
MVATQFSIISGRFVSNSVLNCGDKSVPLVSTRRAKKHIRIGSLVRRNVEAPETPRRGAIEINLVFFQIDTFTPYPPFASPQKVYSMGLGKNFPRILPFLLFLSIILPKFGS